MVTHCVEVRREGGHNATDVQYCCSKIRQASGVQFGLLNPSSPLLLGSGNFRPVGRVPSLFLSDASHVPNDLSRSALEPLSLRSSLSRPSRRVRAVPMDDCRARTHRRCHLFRLPTPRKSLFSVRAPAARLGCWGLLNATSQFSKDGITPIANAMPFLGIAAAGRKIFPAPQTCEVSETSGVSSLRACTAEESGFFWGNTRFSLGFLRE